MRMLINHILCRWLRVFASGTWIFQRATARIRVICFDLFDICDLSHGYLWNQILTNISTCGYLTNILISSPPTIMVILVS